MEARLSTAKVAVHLFMIELPAIAMAMTDRGALIVFATIFFYHISPLSQVYLDLQREGYLVEYQRVPVTDEKSPKERDFDLLVRVLDIDLLVDSH